MALTSFTEQPLPVELLLPPILEERRLCSASRIPGWSALRPRRCGRLPPDPEIALIQTVDFFTHNNDPYTFARLLYNA
jgi:hypothetical protein